MGTLPAGANLRAVISERRLRDLYVAQALTIEQVARLVGLAPTTVGRRLRELGIRPRQRGPLASSSEDCGPLIWTPDIAYAAGLIATDGNLSKKRGRIAITSKDADLLDLLRRRLRIDAGIKPHQGGYGTACHHLAWSDRRFYDWLLDIGLTPAKSLTLGPLAVPDDYFADFFRGCIDGDGSIVSYVDRYNTLKSPSYVYTRLYVAIVSASFRFIEWLRARIRELASVQGAIDVRTSSGRHDIWRLRYAKRESLAVLRWVYYAEDVICLARKRGVAAPFLTPRALPAVRRPGRPVIV